MNPNHEFMKHEKTIKIIIFSTWTFQSKKIEKINRKIIYIKEDWAGPWSWTCSLEHRCTPGVPRRKNPLELQCSSTFLTERKSKTLSRNHQESPNLQEKPRRNLDHGARAGSPDHRITQKRSFLYFPMGLKGSRSGAGRRRNRFGETWRNGRRGEG